MKSVNEIPVCLPQDMFEWKTDENASLVDEEEDADSDENKENKETKGEGDPEAAKKALKELLVKIRKNEIRTLQQVRRADVCFLLPCLAALHRCHGVPLVSGAKLAA